MSRFRFSVVHCLPSGISLEELIASATSPRRGERFVAQDMAIDKSGMLRERTKLRVVAGSFNSSLVGG